MKTPHVELIGRSPLRLGFTLLTFAFAWIAFSPHAQAVCQQGCDLIYSNTFLGDDALLNNNGGGANTAIGQAALYTNLNGYLNTAIGASALYFNWTGYWNTATGASALYSNDAGIANTATGYQALFSNTLGRANTATGYLALYSNTFSDNNTAHGASALYYNTSGRNNTATGYQALYVNTTGNNNTANGIGALYLNTTGSFNIALGTNAGSNLTTGNGNIDIGNFGRAGESRTIRIGNENHMRTFIAGIRDVTTQNTDAIPVLIDSAGQLGTMGSSRRFKKEIRPMDQTSEAILGLKPVTFHYKSDSEGTPQFGLIAEEVAEVNPDLIVRDENGEIYTVRYEAVNAMLLNEFLKEHRTVQELKSIVAKQEATAAHQQKQIEALTAGLQKVSAELETSKPAPQVVNNP